MKAALGMAVRVLRLRGGYSQDDLAAAAGITRQHLNKIEKGEADPKWLTVVNIARAMHFSLTNLVDEYERHLPNLRPTVEILPDQILMYTKIGRLDATNNMQLVEDVFTLAMNEGIHKVLVNLETAVIVFSDQEQFFEVQKAVDWFKERSYRPLAIAVVFNANLIDFGISVARRDGLNVQKFASVAEALKWLRHSNQESG